MAKQNEWMNYALMGGAAYLVYLWYTGQLEIPGLAVDAATAGNGGGASAGSNVATNGSGVAPPPADNGNGNGDNGEAGLPDSTTVIMDRSALRNAMLNAIQGDNFPKNLWRWDFYYQKVSGRPHPQIDWQAAYPGRSVQELEQVEMTIDEWFDLVERYGTGLGLEGMGVYAGGVYQGAVQPNRLPNQAPGLAGTPSPWGQQSSAEATDWSNPAYMSRGMNL